MGVLPSKGGDPLISIDVKGRGEAETRALLNIPRTDKVVVVQVVSRPRTQEKKEAFYRLLTEELEKACDHDAQAENGKSLAMFVTRERFKSSPRLRCGLLWVPW